MNRRIQYLAPIVLSLMLGCTKTALPTIENQKNPQATSPTPDVSIPTTPVVSGTPVTPATPATPATPTPANPVTTPGSVMLPPTSNPTLNPSTTVTPGSPVSTAIGDKFKLQDVVVKVPAVWKLHQDVAQPNIVILGFTNANDDYFRIYVEKDSSKDFSTMFSFKTQTIKPQFSETLGKYQWSRIENRKSGEQVSMVTSSFWMTLNGYSYYGFGRAKDQATAAQITTLFLSNLE